MQSNIELIYWDVCIYIAWLMDEKRPNHEMDGVYESARKIKEGQQKLVCSPIVPAELYKIKMGQQVIATFDRFLKRRGVQYVDYDHRAGSLTSEITEFYSIKGENMDTIDAQHLAISILYKVDAFYTFDKGKRSGMDLLSLSGNVAGHNLKICKPTLPAQLRMDLRFE
jgi:predicted nucleic acid-binding protein